MWKKSTVLLITLLLLLSPLGLTAVQAAGNNAGPVGQIQPLGPKATRLSDLPLALQYKVSEAMGRNQSGYHLERQPNGFRAATPAQGYSTHFGIEGITLSAGQSRLQMQLTGVGYGERLTPVAAALPTSSDNRIEYRRGNVTEWYVNGPLGLQQGFTLQERPEPSALAEQSLTLALAIRGGWQAEVSADGRNLSLTAADGGSLRYGGLVVYDASGQELPARFSFNPRSNIVNILVDDSAATYPLTIDPFIQQAYLKASNAEADDYFGVSVAISGDTVVVGAPYEDSNGTGESDNSASFAGAAYVFVRSGVTWTQQAYLKASNVESGDYFGYSVAISGDTVVVGAPYEDSNGTGESDNSASRAGAAYVYERSGASWSQQTYLKASNAETIDYFGWWVAISGDTVVVGAPYEDSNGTGESDNSALSAGAAYVYERSGASWSQQAYLKASNAEAHDYFGWSVAISGDTVVVGAYGEKSNGTGGESDNSSSEAGAAYVYERSGAAWSQQAYLKASNAESYDYFGYSVAISGDTVVVGAYGEDSNGTAGESDNSASAAGAAYVYVRSGATWSQQAYLKASNAEADDYFGRSVAISGDTVVVGAFAEDSNGTGESDDSASAAGAAYVFVPVTTGSITVVKQVVGDAPATDWSFSSDLGAFTLPAAGGQQLFTDQAAGDYTITETSKDGYAVSVTCDSGESGSNSVTVNLDPGEDVSCTFINTRQGGTIIVEKQTDPHGAAGSFTFTGDAAGAISDDGQIVVGDLLPGTYTATEADPSPEFELTAISCDDGNSSGNVGTRTATFSLEAGETVKCTFTNARRSLQVTKELELPVGGPAAVGQTLRFEIEIFNDGGVDFDSISLTDDFAPWCMTAKRASLPPDSGGGGVAPLVWNDMGPLAAGQRLEMWVEFTAAHGCEDATNTAIVTADGLMFEDEASLRILETVARFGGYAFHDDNGSGALEWPCQGTDNNPVGCEPGIEGATASLDGLLYTTNTSGWWSFNLLDPGTYHVDVAMPMGGSYWTPTGDTWCDATIVNTWDQVFCHRGYWWGLDWPPLLGPVADDTMTFHPTQDTFISAWEAGDHGAEERVQVRQPGYGSTLLEFDRSGLPVDATPVWAKIKLYAPFASNSTNRLYMTAYPLDKAWVEDEVTWLQAENGLPWNAAGATGDHGDPVGWAWIGAPGWVGFDLDPTELLANDYGYLLQGEGSENRQVSYWFFSREYVNGDVQPQLVVGYSVP